MASSNDIFSGKRNFSGRQGEQIYNTELYLLYEIMKHFLDEPTNPDPHFGPHTDLKKAGALWMDRQTNPGFAHVMYHDNDDVWKPIFDDWFKIIKEIRYAGGKPENPVEGQLWISDSGVLHWFNGSQFVPIKSSLADTMDLDVRAFENFLLIDPLKMSGGYMIENLSRLVEAAKGIIEWKPSTLYQLGAMVYYTDPGTGETKFYRYENRNNNWGGATSHTSELTWAAEFATQKIFPIDLKAQYLVPSEVLDKIFIEGLYASRSMYDKLSDVTIQMSLEVYNGKTITAVHVNPVALKNIRKRIVWIENNSQSSEYMRIKAGPENTEYYGFSGGFGTLLVKNDDYLVKADGIQLQPSKAANYDFVYALTYEFEPRIKNEGLLYKGNLTLSNQTIIYIGQIDPADKLLIMVQGLVLEDYYYSYDPYNPDGLIRFNGFDIDGNITDDPVKIHRPLFEGRSDVTVLRFRNKTSTNIMTGSMVSDWTSPTGKKGYQASLDLPSGFIKPLLFVQGPNTSYAGDYTIVNGKAVVVGIEPGSVYYWVDIVRHDNYDTEVSRGIVPADNKIPLPANENELRMGEALPMLFVDGFYIVARDIDMSDSDYIQIHGLIAGQEYILLKDRQDENFQTLFDSEVSFTTIPMKDQIDDAVVYIDRKVIIDGGATYSSASLTDNAVNNEIRMIIGDGRETWRKLDPQTKQWVDITDQNYIVSLDIASAGYSVDDRTINILQNFGPVECAYYAYRFADNIEKPLIKGYTSNWIDISGPGVSGDEIFYKLDFRHSYPIGVNALHVWMNGVKQTITEHKVTETNPATGSLRDVQGFLIKRPTDENGAMLPINPTCYYIIERPEAGEYSSCTFEELTDPIGVSTYRTSNIILSPGVPRLYIDGYRQPNTSFVVEDMSTITITEPVLGNFRDFISVKDKNGNLVITHGLQSKSTVILEMRQDYRLRERSIQLTEDNLLHMIQGATVLIDASTMYKENKTIPREFFHSLASEMSVYINGANYGKDFSKVKNQDAITLTNIEVVKTLAAGDIITLEWR